jgi:hypothetical protein
MHNNAFVFDLAGLLREVEGQIRARRHRTIQALAIGGGCLGHRPATIDNHPFNFLRDLHRPWRRDLPLSRFALDRRSHQQ